MKKGKRKERPLPKVGCHCCLNDPEVGNSVGQDKNGGRAQFYLYQLERVLEILKAKRFVHGMEISGSAHQMCL